MNSMSVLPPAVPPRTCCSDRGRVDGMIAWVGGHVFCSPNQAHCIVYYYKTCKAQSQTPAYVCAHHTEMYSKGERSWQVDVYSFGVHLPAESCH